LYGFHPLTISKNVITLYGCEPKPLIVGEEHRLAKLLWCTNTHYFDSFY
jgi:hypothetical protein